MTMLKSTIALPEPRLELEGGEALTFETAKILRHKARLSGMNPNYWYPIEWSKHVPAKKVVEVEFWNQSIALYRGEDGQVAALENRCPHRHIPLTLGHVKGCNLVCIYHGWTYSPEGELVEMKHDDFGKKMPKVSVQTWPVREKYGLIWMFPGHPELADRTPLVHIPEAEGPDKWAHLTFDYTWQAHHSMVIDNLCNLTHLYVHGKWVPYDLTHLADSSHEGDRITLDWHHTLRRDALFPMYRVVFRKQGTEDESRSFMTYDYPYQSVLSNNRIKSCNFLSPISEGRTRVFSVQLWKRPKVLGTTNRLGGELFQRFATPVLKQITMEVFRQDGATVEAEMERMEANFFRPIPEPNHSVKYFDRLNAERWQAWLDSQARGEPELGAAPERVKVL